MHDDDRVLVYSGDGLDEVVAVKLSLEVRAGMESVTLVDVHVRETSESINDAYRDVCPVCSFS